MNNTEDTNTTNQLENLLKNSETLHDIVWTACDFIIQERKYIDLVIYLYDEQKKSLLQMAAFGDNKSKNQIIQNPIRIEPGEGIVGRVFQSGIPRVIGDTTRDGNYIIDDRFRLSEISIPILSRGKIIGVIDSEHPSENYYSNEDKAFLMQIAKVVGEKIASITM
jgi:putative methionine-R-sulfoxide reductase with GAF domain